MGGCTLLRMLRSDHFQALSACSLKGPSDHSHGYALCLSNLHPLHRDDNVMASGVTSSSPLGLCNARSVYNKITALQDVILDNNFDLACYTKTWVRGTETVSLSPLAPPGFLVPH